MWPARLLQGGHNVTGVDNLSDYYDVRLKQARLNMLQANPTFRFIRMDLADSEKVHRFFIDGKFDAAQVDSALRSRYTRGTRRGVHCGLLQDKSERPGPCKYFVILYFWALSRR
jgi:hypothetical protein